MKKSAKNKAWKTKASAGLLTVVATAGLIPSTAFAASTTDTLDSAVKLLTNGIGFLGGVLIVFGLINLGMTIKDGMQGGGGQLAGAIAMIIGGGIVVFASGFFALYHPAINLTVRRPL